MTFDASHIAYGCINLQKVQFANMGPAILTMAFEQIGITALGGGMYIHESWSGEKYPSEARTPVKAINYYFGGAEHDCIMENIIIYSGLVGVHSSNGANRIQGVHTWNLKGAEGGTGIYLEKGKGRV